MATVREGSLEAPTRHPLDWKSEEFYDETALNAELERVFDACHGCRRCVSLCQSFPTLFDLVDESETMEIDGVAKSDYGKVVDHCYLCDLCYMTKCPYVPPHEWAIDFPHLMLRAKAVKHRKGQTNNRDKLITNTDTVGRFATIPVVVNAVNAANKTPILRKALESTLGIHAEANLPRYESPTLRQRLRDHTSPVDNVQPAGRTHQPDSAPAQRFQMAVGPKQWSLHVPYVFYRLIGAYLNPLVHGNRQVGPETQTGTRMALGPSISG